MNMQVERVGGAFGARVSGVDVSCSAPAPLRALMDLLYAHRFLVVSGQQIDADAFGRFGAAFGEPVRLANVHRTLPGHPEILMLSNAPDRPLEERDDALHWHTDGSYMAEPFGVTMLYGLEAPESGGETRFVDMVAAYEALSSEMKAEIAGRYATHYVFGGKPMDGENIPQTTLSAADRARMQVQRHPLAIRHPVTGATALYAVSGTPTGVDGLPAADGEALLEELKLHAVQPRFQSGHKTAPGELLIWDNFATMHTATPIEYSAEPGRRRLLMRISAKGVPPTYGVEAALRAA